MSRISEDIVVQEIIEKLQSYPSAVYRITEKSLEIDPPNEGGFGIDLYPDGHMWTVCFGEGGLHDHFFEASDTVDFIGFGLSKTCRLREIKRPLLQEARLEIKTENKWELVHAVCMLNWPLPLKRSEQIFQNLLV